MAITNTFTWNAGSDNWSTSTNWANGGGSGTFAVGSAANSEVFDLAAAAGPYTVSLDLVSITAGQVNITSANATLDITNGDTLKAGAPAATGAGGAFSETAGAVSMLGGTLSFISYGISGGSFSGFGTITNTAVSGATLSTSGSGEIVASGGVLTVLGSSASFTLGISSGVSFGIAGTGDLDLSSSVTLSSGSVDFQGAAGTLALANNTALYTAAGSTETFNATLNDLEVGSAVGSDTGASVIDLQGRSVTSGSIVGSTVEVVSAGVTYEWNTSGTSLTGAHVNFASDGSGGTNIWLDTNPCYAAGTRILTDRGEVAVEDLAEGDMVVTLSGSTTSLRPVRWIGHRRMNLRQHPQPNLVAPVRVRQHAFGRNLPSRDLLVSPDHCLFVDEKLIPAKLLINDMTIVQERGMRDVTYYHVELDRHSVVLAEGLPAESYLDTGNRAMFANAGLALVLHPDFEINAHLKCWETDACAPLTVSQEVVKPIWQRLADDAVSQGYQRPAYATTDDPDLRIVAGGRSIRPLTRENGRYVFALPAGAGAARLTSRATVPSHMAAYVDDWRHLGVAVRRITVHGSDGLVEFPPDHPGLTQGWHAVERDDATMWRWMDGDAVLPIPGMDVPVLVEVHVGMSMTHVADSAAPQGARLAA